MFVPATLKLKYALLELNATKKLNTTGVPGHVVVAGGVAVRGVAVSCPKAVGPVS